jgi:hypothetical protein
LKRFLSILSALIFDSSVDRGMPNLPAAPYGPNTRQLDRAYVQRDDDLIVTKVDPLLKNLHNDPRYVAFLKKLNLPS